MEERPPIWRIGANTVNKQSLTAEKGWSSRLGVGRGAKTPHRKKYLVIKCSNRKPRTWTDTLVRPKQRKRGMNFGT